MRASREGLVSRDERRKSANLIAEVSNREANLRAIESQEHKEGKTVDHSAAFRAMAAEKFAIDEDEKRKEIELETSANLQIIANDRTLADAQIEATSKVQQAQLALVETRDKLAFSHADTVADVEKAALPIVSDINKLYEFRSITIAEQTRALEAQLQLWRERPLHCPLRNLGQMNLERNLKT